MLDEDDTPLYDNEYPTAIGHGKYVVPKGAALMMIKEYWAEGKQLPSELRQYAKEYMEKDAGHLLPSRTTLKRVKTAIDLLCSRQAKNVAEAAKMVGRRPSWLYNIKKHHPGIISNFERDYYRDIEETAERARWGAKQKSIIKAAEMEEVANARLKKTLEDDEVASAVHVSAVKQVHDILGVVPKRGDGSRMAQTWKPNEAERAILQSLAPREVDAVDAEIIEDGH